METNSQLLHAHSPSTHAPERCDGIELELDAPKTRRDERVSKSSDQGHFFFAHGGQGGQRDREDVETKETKELKITIRKKKTLHGKAV